MKNQDNNWIEIIDNPELDQYGLAINNDIANLNLGKTSKIKYDYIDFKGVVDMKNDETGEVKKFSYIEFNKKFPKEYLKTIKGHIEKILEERNITISDAFEQIINLFKKSTFKKELEKDMSHDIATLIFLIKLKQKFNIEFDKYIELYEDEFRFNYNDKLINIMNVKKAKNELKIKDFQLNEHKDSIIILSKFKFEDSKINIEDDKLNIEENKKNIIDLFNILGSNHTVLLDRKKDWENIIKDIDIDILGQYKIDLEKCDSELLNNDIIPIIEIKHMGALKTMEVSIDVSGANVQDLSFLKDILKLNS